MSSSKVMGQKEAVIYFVSNILKDGFVPGITLVKEVLSSSELKTLQDSVTEGILQGTIEYNGKATDIRQITTYAKGMIQDHLRRAKELNGGREAQGNAASKKNDSELENMKKLARHYKKIGDNEKAAVLINAISERKAAQQKEVKLQEAYAKINVDILPQEIVEALNNG